jgi:hypothetical protein
VCICSDAQTWVSCALTGRGAHLFPARAAASAEERCTELRTSKPLCVEYVAELPTWPRRSLVYERWVT